MRTLKRFLPLPLAMAALVAAAFPAYAAEPAAKAQKQAAVNPAAFQAIRLSTGLKDGKMVFLDEKGNANPTLKANVGDTLEITISSGEGAQHDIAFPQLGVASKKFDAATGATKLRFKVTKGGSFEYICTVAGHRQVGMEGVLEVAGGKVAARPVASSAGSSATPRFLDSVRGPSIEKAQPAVSVSMDPNAVPAPLGARAPQTVKYRVETVELAGKLDDGTTFTYWTFDKKVPGPMLRVKKGDSVEFTLVNAKSSKMVHSID
jgi:nitrite reductase (NO-forming)